MSDPLLAVAFLVCACVSLGSSWVLVFRLERVGARLGISEALLGMLAALAADGPEITSSVTALIGHHSQIGAGVAIGSNVFNLAALLGLAAVLAGRIALHRRVILMEGIVALWIAGVCVVTVVRLVPPAVALALVLGVLAPYVLILGISHERLKASRLHPAWVDWIIEAIEEEELELHPAIHPQRGGTRDGAFAAIAVLIVVAASVAMEQASSRLGSRHGVPDIVVGGLVLAAVTSLPNAVAAVYLARRGRGTATLSTAMNSNALNVAAGLLLPATIVGLSDGSDLTALVAAWYFALTALALVLAYIGRGLRREHGALIICAYLAFGGVLLATAYSSTTGIVVSIAVSAALATVLAARLIRNHNRTSTAAVQTDSGQAKLR